MGATPAGVEMPRAAHDASAQEAIAAQVLCAPARVQLPAWLILCRCCAAVSGSSGFVPPDDVWQIPVCPRLHHVVLACHCCLNCRASTQDPAHRATRPVGADPKWRFMWRLGDRPRQTRFAELNAEPVVPAGEAARCERLRASTTTHLRSSHVWAPLCAMVSGIIPYTIPQYDGVASLLQLICRSLGD